MPLPDFLDRFNPALLNTETFEQFKAALLQEYRNDVSVLDGKIADAGKSYADKVTALETENKDLKAANWDMWKRIPGDESVQKTSDPQPEDSDDEEAPSIDSFFAPAKS